MGSDGVARRQWVIGQPQLCPDFLHLSSHSEGITIAIIASDCYWIYWILGILTCPKAVHWAQSEKQEYLRCIVRHCKNQVDLTPIWCQKWRSDDDHCKYAKFLAHVGQLLANGWPFDQTRPDFDQVQRLWLVRAWWLHASTTGQSWMNTHRTCMSRTGRDRQSAGSEAPNATDCFTG